MKKFLNQLYDKATGFVYLWVDKTTYSFPVDELDKMAEQAQKLTENGNNVYFGVCGTRQRLGTYKRPKQADISFIPGFWVDIDIQGEAHKSDNLPPDWTAALSLLPADKEPTIIVDSGYGLHAYWLFDSPWVLDSDEDRQHAFNASKAFQQTINARAGAKGWKVDSTHDLSRILRLPGTKNYKLEKENPPLCRIVTDSGVLYNLNDFAIHHPKNINSHTSKDTTPPKSCQGRAMPFYSGYVLTKGKAPIEPFKDRKGLKSLEDVELYPEYAGVLAEDIILIDIDDAKQSDILYQIISDMRIDCVVRQTTRGKHFLFENREIKQNGTKKKLACGLTADIKLGSRNSVQVLKFDGQERPILRQSDNLAPLPKWLYPVHSNVNFYGMTDGDGRDSGLYGYILTLTNAGFSQPEIIECIEIINNYILGEPLTSKDIARITREEAFPGEVFFNDKKFLHDNFARFLINNDHIKRINGQLHIYQEGVYVPDQRLIELKMIEYIPNLKARQRTEVYKYMELVAPGAEVTTQSDLIAFANGVYNLSADELKPFSPDYIILNRIPWNFNAKAEAPIVDKFLDDISCHDESIRKLLEEAIGYCFYRKNIFAKSFFLLGDGANGKSTFLTMIGELIGSDNRSALSIDDIGSRFKLADMAGKLLNAADDISDNFIEKSTKALFKAIVSGGEITAEFKGEPAFKFKPYAKLFFSANDLPKVGTKGFEAIKRRFTIIPFDARFYSDNPDYDPLLINKLCTTEAMEYLIQLGIRGLIRLLKCNAFTSSKKVAAMLEDFEQDNNHIFVFVTEELDFLEGNIPKDVYRQYGVFCIERGIPAVQYNNFVREIKRQFNYIPKPTWVNGRTHRVFQKQ